MDDLKQLDRARQAMLDAKAEIQRLREKIAKEKCPLRVGEHVTIVRDGTEFQGIVDSIHPAVDRRELLDPVVGAPAGWAVSGPKIKKDGEQSKLTFGLSSLDAELNDGKWIVTTPSIDDVFASL
ncbi:hypothetical protein [Rhizobium paknamense]|uniref:Uncharacterized protein n=1 Tax=Rhizobium paknamense TaxID=1206817 RepID=A0ABU0IM19_9HYPH|nr:hypothetical protein [Rhizobium paknamense]MDQ0458271.1 hypothetical protein [Rhizobium paknamense]